MSDLKTWFTNEVFAWKCGGSVIWAIILQFLLLQTFLFFHSVISWHPYVDLKGWLLSLFSLSMLSYQILLITSTFCVALLHIQHFSVEPTVHTTRLKIIWSFLRPPFLFHLLVHCLAGGMVVRCLVGLIGGDIANLEIPCNDCKYGDLSEKHLFIILHGMFSGFIFSITYFRNELYCVNFPIIQQLKFLAMKSRMHVLLIKSIQHTLKYIKWYYLFFFLLGAYPRHWISSLLGLHIRFEASLMSLTNLLDVKLFFFTLITGTLLNLIWNYSLSLFEIYITERFVIPVEAAFETEKEKTLPYALRCISFPLLQCLGYLDLRLLSQHSHSRRLQIFAISQPGGHPYNWEAISKECLSLLETFTVNLNNATFPPSQSAAKANGSTPSGINAGTAVWIWTNFTVQKCLLCLKKNPVFRYFLGELPDAKMKKTFSGCQPVIWAVEALSFLVAASFTEDHYGVVQKSLPRVISDFLDLHVALERQQKAAALVKRHIRSVDPLSKDIQLRQALCAAVNSGIYRIVCTFNVHLSGISLSEEHQRYLKLYVEFKA